MTATDTNYSPDTTGTAEAPRNKGNGAESLLGDIKSELGAAAQAQGEGIADTLEDAAEAVKRSGEQLEGHQDWIAELVESGAEELKSLAGSVRDKDFDGLLTFPSKVPLANESGAVHKPPMRSYARAVRFAHDKGLRVIARVSCFNDNLMAKAHPSMAIRGVSGHVYHNGWIDPKNEIQQQYVIDLSKEAMENGADEIQLDYVRFPVIGMKNIDYGLDTIANPEAKIEVITSFVERVHKTTHARGIPLSLDVFGVIAFGKVTDMRNLGQDPAILSKHAEFLSPMVYPSHFDPGFMNLDAPADHPELVGMGVGHMNDEIDDVPQPRAKIRPWASAMRHTATNYGASYIQEEIRTSDKHGGSGWLLWNPGQVYEVAWSALPRHTEKTDKPVKLAKLTKK